MNILIICLIVIGIGSIVNRLIKASEEKKSVNNIDDTKKEAQIEVGYPGSKSRALHINSTIEPSQPNHYFTDKELGHFYNDEDDMPIKSIYTVNRYVESHHELNLSLFGKELTIQMVNDAYEKILNEHFDNIRNGIPADFNIDEKKEARDYLIAKLNNETKGNL